MRTNSPTSSHRSLDLVHAGDVINFYSDTAQRRRGLTALDLPHSACGLVLAAARSDIGFFSNELRDAGVSILNINLVEMTPDWRRGISHLLDACLHTQQTHRCVHLLADFGGQVHCGQIFELESLLRSATSEWKMRCVTQYDARQFSDAIDVDALSRFGVVLFGHYYQDGALPGRRQHHETAVSEETADISAD